MLFYRELILTNIKTPEYRLLRSFFTHIAKAYSASLKQFNVKLLLNLISFGCIERICLHFFMMTKAIGITNIN